jgi:hypothetical protein
MDTLLFAIIISSFLLAILTMAFVIRDVFPLLSQEDQTSFRNYLTEFGTWRGRNRAIRNAWNEHLRSFPNSRKRVLFAFFLIVFALSVMARPLWLAFGAR